MKGYRFYADIPGTEWDLDTPHPIPGNLTRKHTMPAKTNIARLREFADKGGKVNCIAFILGKEFACDHIAEGGQECFASIFAYPNSDVAVTGVSRFVLRRCRHISEPLARKLHPRLFERLDEPEDA